MRALTPTELVRGDLAMCADHGGWCSCDGTVMLGGADLSSVNRHKGERPRVLEHLTETTYNKQNLQQPREAGHLNQELSYRIISTIISNTEFVLTATPRIDTICSPGPPSSTE